MFAQIALSALLAGVANAQVTATGTMGVTNPPQATMGTSVNQTSYARLASINSISDWCMFAPPEPNSIIGNTETEEVAWCVQPRNNARVIPDGTLQAVHFVKTPLYVQVMGWGDFTKLNIQYGDQGGELDPHGATGNGNPIGGNVTSNVSGTDVHYEEWMNYISYQQFCIRVCTAENSTYSAALECQHTLDEMGCNWVMPGDYTNNSFTSCNADAAYPPGVYPLANGSTSTFAQRYTGTYTAGGTVGTFTVGQTVTPQTPFSTPASSQCTTYSSVGNGIASLGSGAAVVTGSAASGSASRSGSMSGSMSASGSMSTSKSSTSGSASGVVSAASGAVASASKSGAAMAGARVGNGPVVAALLSAVALMVGAGAVML